MCKVSAGTHGRLSCAPQFKHVANTCGTTAQAIQTQGNEGMFLYSAVSSPSARSKHFTLYPLADLLFRHINSTSLGRILVSQQLLHEDYSLTFSPLSIARYSFVQLSELGRCVENRNAQASKQQQRGFEPGLSIESPAFYHWPTAVQDNATDCS